MLSKISQRKTNTVSFHICVESKKLKKWKTNKTNRLINIEKLIIVRELGGGGMGENVKGTKKYKGNINKSQGWEVTA